MVTIEDVYAWAYWEETCAYRPEGITPEELAEKITANLDSCHSLDNCKGVIGLFVWASSLEGHDFWGNIYWKYNPRQDAPKTINPSDPRIGISDKIDYDKLPKRLRDW